MYRKGSGTIWNGRCTYCDRRVRGELELGSAKGQECGEFLFCDTWWNKMPFHIQQRCNPEKK